MAPLSKAIAVQAVTPNPASLLSSDEQQRIHHYSGNVDPEWTVGRFVVICTKLVFCMKYLCRARCFIKRSEWRCVAGGVCSIK